MLISICNKYILLYIYFTYLFCRENQLLSFVRGIDPTYRHSGGGGIGVSFIADLIFAAGLDTKSRQDYLYLFTMNRELSSTLPQADSGFELTHARQGALREDVLNRKFVPNPHAKVAALLAMCRAGGKF